MPMTIWAVFFRDHIHTDMFGKLTVFNTRDEARAWIKTFGMPSCRIVKFQSGGKA